MAALTPQKVYSTGTSTKLTVYKVRNVDSGDTIALSGDYNRILVAAAFNSTRSLAYFAPSIAGTTLTLTEASMADDTCFVFVLGAGANDD